MRWQWLAVVSMLLGSPVWGQGIPANSPSGSRESVLGQNRLTAETDFLLPLGGSADRIDGVAERGWVAVGLLEEQAVTLLDLAGGDGDPLWYTSVGFAPSVVRVDAARQVLYASGPNAPGLVAIDLRTGELIQAYGLAAGVLDIALDPATGRVFASMPSAQSLAVIHPDQPRARNLPLPGPPLALVYEPERGSLFVGLAGEDPLSLVVVNPDNGELLARWRGGNTPEMLALDSRGQRLVILNSGSQDLTVLDLNRSGETLQRIGLDWRPTRLVLSPDGQWAYVTSRDSNRLQVVNLQQGRLVASLRLEGQPTGLMMAGRDLWVVAAGIPALLQLRDMQTRAAAITAKQGDLAEATAVPGYGVVTGQVLDIAGKPVQTGVLRLAATATHPQQEIRIAADGSYVLPPLPAGLYLVDVEVPGFPITSTQVEVRSGFVASQDIHLPPGEPIHQPQGIGLLPDEPVYSDELARHLSIALQELQPQRQVMLLNGPLGPDPKFEPLLPLTRGLTLLDRDERYTSDLAKLKVIGDALGLRYILLTQLQISREYSRQGNSLLNTALRFVAPMVPVEIPNFTPNQLRSRGLVVVVDLQRDRPGDQARYYEAYGRDDVGGDPLFEDAAAGLFRLQVRNMVPVFVNQWQSNNPFAG
ncbi:MAG: carboxypeptidase regulatory-like domain-containing protein [Thermostichus sp. DG_1_6_bins_120]